MHQASDLKKLQKNLLIRAIKTKYTYNFRWFGLPIIQFPQDIIAMQEIIYKVKPDLIIETGIARGGSLIFYASMLEILGKGTVLGIDIDIREHNRKALEKHFLFKRIKMFEGSSTDLNIFEQVKKIASNNNKILVALDSNHTHSHVLKELELYSSLVSKDSYLVVFDTSIEDVPDDMFPNRPWDKKNNPKTALKEFLSKNDRFIIDKTFEEKLLITANIDGYLKCIK
ncbi:MAG: Rhamnosyl O-methyltransferase [Candidatus Anoxychlamydiales bacterium]|nr:Rhamnosyl O-methyltransferase [Candidatus Anoxychlamydiales bacterium]